MVKAKKETKTTAKKVTKAKAAAPVETPYQRSCNSSLHRICGQIEGITKMVLDDRSTTDILIQIRAVRASMKTVEFKVLNHYIDTVLAGTITNEKKRDEKVAEIVDMLGKRDY